MDIRQLKYFLTITEEGQITGAAKKLHIAQPPLSNQLKLLESELGVKLLERGSRKVKLTDAGERLRDRAEQILELTDNTVKELKDFSEGIQGTLSIGMISTSGAVLLPDRIRKFSNKYPNVNFQIREGNTYKILEILESGLIEIGIVRTPFKMGNFQTIWLEKEPMVAAYNDDKFIDSSIGDSVTLSDIKEKPLVIYRRFENLIMETFYDAGFNPRIVCKTDDSRTALLWAYSGLGIAIVPRVAVNLMPDSDLKFKIINEEKLNTKTAAIWVKGRYLSSVAQNFLKSLQE